MPTEIESVASSRPDPLFLAAWPHMDLGLHLGWGLGLGRLANGLRNRRPLSRGRTLPLLGRPGLRALLGRRQA